MICSQLLVRSVTRGIGSLFSRKSLLDAGQPTIQRNFHFLTENLVSRIITPKIMEIAEPSNLLKVSQPQVNQVCGMKHKGRIKLRCKDCYFVVCEGRWFVRCKTFGKHKQAQIVKKEKNTWILTSVSQKPKRPWW